MEAFQQLGQELVNQVMAQPGVILGAIVGLICFVFGGKKGQEAVAEKARAAITQAEQDLAKTGQEKFDEALDLVIGMLPSKVRLMAALAKPLLKMVVQQIFDQEFAHFKRGSADATPAVPPVSVLEAEAERAREMLGGSIADTLLELPKRDDQ